MDVLHVSDGLDIRLDGVKTLKVLNDKLFVVLSNDLVVEVTGLTSRDVDKAFKSYTAYLKQHGPLATHRA